MPEIILYIVVGFCFIKIYSFVYIYNDAKENGISDKLILYLVFGFLICQTCFAFPFSFGKYADNVCIVVFSIMFGYFAAKMMNSKCINRFLDIIKIRRTVNTYLWNDLMDLDFPMKAKVTINNNIYNGKIHLIEEFSNNPHIVLAEYSINGNENMENNKIIVLDSSKASEIIIEYDKNSPMLDEISFL